MASSLASSGENKHSECSCVICRVINRGFSSFSLDEKKQIICNARTEQALDAQVDIQPEQHNQQ
ncbi:hypothetical protein ILUMI_19519, partial [Ignelater luminosus]